MREQRGPCGLYSNKRSRPSFLSSESPQNVNTIQSLRNVTSGAAKELLPKKERAPLEGSRAILGADFAGSVPQHLLSTVMVSPEQIALEVPPRHMQLTRAAF